MLMFYFLFFFRANSELDHIRFNLFYGRKKNKIKIDKKPVKYIENCVNTWIQYN